MTSRTNSRKETISDRHDVAFAVNALAHGRPKKELVHSKDVVVRRGGERGQGGGRGAGMELFDSHAVHALTGCPGCAVHPAGFGLESTYTHVHTHTHPVSPFTQGYTLTPADIPWGRVLVACRWLTAARYGAAATAPVPSSSQPYRTSGSGYRRRRRRRQRQQARRKGSNDAVGKEEAGGREAVIVVRDVTERPGLESVCCKYVAGPGTPGTPHGYPHWLRVILAQ